MQGVPTHYWTQIHFYHEGDTYFRSIIEHIRLAQNEIVLEFYIFKTDMLGSGLLNELILASQRGVQVKILIDGIGSFWWVKPIRNRIKNTSIHFKVYQGIPLDRLNVYRVFHIHYLRSLLKFFKLINRRNHRKVVIIDNSIAYIGGLNVSHEHCSEFVGPLAWRDSGCRLQGPEIYNLKKSFDKVWYKKLFPIRAHWLRFNFSLRDRFRSNREFIKKIKKAKSVCIVNPYFVPVRSVIRALVYAAKRGADVKIIVPYESDVAFLKWASRYFYKKLLKAGVKVYEYRASILHAKYMIVDEWARLGSQNLNHRSLLHDLEADAIFVDFPSIQHLKSQFQKDLEKSQELTTDELVRLGWLANIKCYVVLFFRYWL